MAEHIVDLDVFDPKLVVVRFQGKDITVNPASTLEYLKMRHAADVLADNKSSDGDLINAINKLHTIFGNLIPELKGTTLNQAQLAVLLGMFRDMLIPDSVREILDQGITKGDGNTEGKPDTD